MSSSGQPDSDVSNSVELKQLVKKIVNSHSWWQRYGREWFDIFVSSLVYIAGIECFRIGGTIGIIMGSIFISLPRPIFSNRASHLAAHNGLCETTWINDLVGFFFSDFINQFSYKAGTLAHIKGHHPYTNVIGYGDSSTFRMPFLSRSVYLFMMPFLLPLLGPFVSIAILVEKRVFGPIFIHVPIAASGFILEYYLFRYACELSVCGSLMAMYWSRAAFSVPFVHINIFQHIGLEFYSYSERPKSRLYQMSHSVLNLTDCGILDWTFGAGLVTCHIEHHLFPNLSDNMLRKIQPVVKAYVVEKGMPYIERSYTERLSVFWNKYEVLMVDPPTVLSFVGLQ